MVAMLVLKESIVFVSMPFLVATDFMETRFYTVFPAKDYHSNLLYKHAYLMPLMYYFPNNSKSPPMSIYIVKNSCFQFPFRINKTSKNDALTLCSTYVNLMFS